MTQHWLVQQHNDRLIIFVLGWACDSGCVAHLATSFEGCDVLCVYGYGGLEPEADYGTLAAAIVPYTHRTLVAWSFGVWVAEQVFAGVKFDWAVAYCGSPFPVSAEFGIDPKRLAITVRGVTAHGSDGFNRRAYGNSYERLKSVLSPRGLDSDVAELKTLARLASVAYTPAIEWDMAVVGSEDTIFPQENLVRYWGSRSQVLPLPHYPFEDGKIVESELKNR